MAQKKCPECGYPLTDSMTTCPECGTQLQNATSDRQDEAANSQPHQYTNAQRSGEHATATKKMTHCRDCGGEISLRAYRCPHCGSMLVPDFGNAVYETFCKKYATFTGRSRRAEFFSFFTVFAFLCFVALGSERSALIFVIPVIIPLLAVSIRRLHDIGRSGWWILCPVVPFFFYFKDSDESVNEYGASPKYQPENV